jgi:hypothetical protein
MICRVPDKFSHPLAIHNTEDAHNLVVFNLKIYVAAAAIVWCSAHEVEHILFVEPKLKVRPLSACRRVCDLVAAGSTADSVRTSRFGSD